MNIKVFFAILVTIFITAGVIYATPLRYTSLIPAPAIVDQDPKAFFAEYTKNPEHYIFLDVRDKAEYDAVHAKGAISMPLATLYDQRHFLPMNGKEIVLICAVGKSSGVAYSYLQHFGFTNIRRILGGTENWIAEGLPTESSVSTTTAAAFPHEASAAMFSPCLL